jgi:hypothetical protein
MTPIRDGRGKFFSYVIYAAAESALSKVASPVFFLLLLCISALPKWGCGGAVASSFAYYLLLSDYVRYTQGLEKLYICDMQYIQDYPGG